MNRTKAHTNERREKKNHFPLMQMKLVCVGWQDDNDIISSLGSQRFRHTRVTVIDAKDIMQPQSWREHRARSLACSLARVTEKKTSHVRIHSRPQRVQPSYE